MPNSGITIEEIQIKITQESTNAVNGIESLAKSLQGLKSITSGGIRGLNTVAKQLERLNAAISAMPDLSKFEQLRDILAQIKGLGDIEIGKNIDTKNLEKAVNGIEDNANTEKPSVLIPQSTSLVPYTPQEQGIMPSVLQDYSIPHISIGEEFQRASETAQAALNAISDPMERLRMQIELQQLKVSQLGAAYAELKAANGGEDNANTAQAGLQYLSALDTLERYKAKLMELASTAGYTKRQLEELSAQIGYTGNTATKSQKGFSQLLRMFKRATLYRIFFQLLSTVKKAIQDGLKNLVQFSDEANNTMSAFKTMGNQLKNSFGAAFEPLLAMLIPIFQIATDALVEMLNVVNMLASALAGRTEMTVATNQWQDYAKSVNNAQKSVSGFDELNKMSATNSTSGMFETIDISDVSGGTGITDIFQTLFEWVTKLFDAIKPLITLLTKLVVSVLSPILKTISQILDALTPIIDVCVNIIDAVLAPIMEAVSGVMEVVQRLLDGILAPLAPMIEKIANIISSLLNAALFILQPFLDAISTVLSMIFQVLSPLIDLIIEAVEIALTSFNIKLDETNNAMAPLIEAFQSCANCISGAFKGAFQIIQPIIEMVTNLLNDLVSFVGHVFAGEWEAAWNDIVKFFKDIWNGLISFGKGIINGFLTGVGACVNWVIDFINSLTGGLSSVWTWTGLPSIGKIPNWTVPQLAEGGFVSSGELFIANESGPEMVGSIGGQTAVANNNQIVEAIKLGVIEAMAASAVGGDWTIQVVDGNGRVTGQSIVTAAQRKNIRDGKTVIQLGT